LSTDTDKNVVFSEIWENGEGAVKMAANLADKQCKALRVATRPSKIMNTPQHGLNVETPSPVSCMATRESALILGSEDGTVRRYTLPDTKVKKALLGLANNVSWIRFSVKGKEEHVWLATGMSVCLIEYF